MCGINNACMLLLLLLTVSLVSFQAAVSPVVIVALGDSTTAGTPAFKSPIEAPPNGSGNEESQYAFWLMQQHREWRVLNRGVNGERTDQIAARFERDVLAEHPRIVVILAGVNDVYQGRPVDFVKAQLRAMYDRAKQAGMLVVAGSIIPYNTASAEQNAKMHEINAWIADQAARDPKIKFVDTRKAAASPQDPDHLSGSPDGLHPDVAGYRNMAAAIEAVLAILVRG
jgi:lysophospholipase L1-like esterase